MKLFDDFWKFTKIWKDLHHSNTELFLFWFLDVQNNFMFPTCKNRQKWIKKSEINAQTFVIWWLNSRRYWSVWYLFSCTRMCIFYIKKNQMLGRSRQLGVGGFHTLIIHWSYNLALIFAFAESSCQPFLGWDCTTKI